MSLGTSNRDGGKTSESGHLRAVYKALIGEVLSGIAVSQRGAGANMSVDLAIGDAVLPRSDGTYGHPVFNDAVLNKTITAADPSNPRRDIVVLYLDYSVTPSTGVSNNTNGVVLSKVVAGTPAGSPSDPSDATIQSSVGSGNPWIKLARVRVGAGVTSIANSVIDDLRRMAHGLSQGGWIYDSNYTWVYASATSFTVAGVDVTSQFPKGTRIALYQGGTLKYFYVTSSSFSTNTTVNIDGSTLNTLANLPIDKPAYSYEARPTGFPYASISEPLNWWQEIARVTLGVAGDTLSVSSIPFRKYNRVIFKCIATGTISVGVRFNNDSGANYAFRYDANAVSGSSVGATSFASIGGGNVEGYMDFNNNTTMNKQLIVHSTSGTTAGTAPDYTAIRGLWANVAAITRFDLVNLSSGDFAIGTEMIILGHD